MDDVWAAPDGGWTGVSPRLGTARRLVLLAVSVPAALVVSVAVLALFGAAAAIGVLACSSVTIVLVARLVDRQWRAIGYAERTGDLLVKRGVLFRQLVVVPYGRMQFVDVTGGPLERRFDIVTVQLHTASAATDASIPGLRPDEAARLRDRLASLGLTHTAGL